MPKDEAWVWHESEQHEKYARAREMADTRLCVFCQAADVVMRQKRGSDGKGDTAGHWVTFEQPTPS